MVCASCTLGVGVAEPPLKASRLLKIQAAHAIIGHTDVNERTECKMHRNHELRPHTHTHTHTPKKKKKDTHTHTHRHTPHRHKHTPTAYSRPRSSTMSNAFASGSALGSLVRDCTEEELAESCSSSSSESSGSEVEIEKVQPSASAGGGGGAAGSGGARAAPAPAPAPAPQARKSTQTRIAGFFSKPALTVQ